jgi:hypothetical protein
LAELRNPTRMAQPSQQPPPEWPSPAIRWTFSIILLALVVVLVIAAVLGVATSPVLRAIIGVMMALFFAGFVFLVIPAPSSAEASGQINLGVTTFSYRSAGAVAAGLIMFVLFLWFTSTPYQAVDVRLFTLDGAPLDKGFSVKYYHPDTGQQQLTGHDGIAVLRGLPASLDQLDVSVTCPGYTMKDSPPFPIRDRMIRVVMIPETQPPPPRSELPNVEPGDLPAKEKLAQPPKVTPANVTFHYHNQTGENLSLLMYDCASHHDADSNDLKIQPRWMRLDFPAGPPLLYERFQSGNGWFLFFVRNNKGENHALGNKNIFQSRNPRLTVTKQRDQYTAVFTFED